MITIYNRQRTYDKQLGYADFALCIWVTTDRTIRYYNRVFRSKDKATDVISFPFHPDVKPGEPIVPEDADERVLGDIIISAARVARQAQELHTSLYQQLRRLVVHGICHLLGYDHQTDAEYKDMIALEKQLLALFYQTIPSDP